jgi:hypothetical protein
MTPDSEPVLHIDFVSVSATAEHGREMIIEAAARLSEMESVIAVGAIEADANSDFDLAVYFLLPSFVDLEPFGTDPRYVRFLQGTVAPNLKAFGGASVRLEAALPQGGMYAACVAVEAPPETYDWEVSEKLMGWADSQTGDAVYGLAIGERQRYRGIALAFSEQLEAQRPDLDGFEVAFLAGSARRLA